MHHKYLGTYLLISFCFLVSSLVAQIDSINNPPNFPFEETAMEDVKDQGFKCCTNKIQIKDKTIELASLLSDQVKVKKLINPTILYQSQNLLLINDINQIYSLEIGKKGKLLYTPFDNQPLIIHKMQNDLIDVELIENKFVFTIAKRKKNDSYGFSRAIYKHYYSTKGKHVKTVSMENVNCRDDHLWSKEDKKQPAFYQWNDILISWSGGSRSSIRLTNSKDSKVVYETPLLDKFNSKASKFTHEFYFENGEALLAVNDCSSSEIYLRFLKLKDLTLTEEVIKLNGMEGKEILLLDLDRSGDDVRFLFGKMNVEDRIVNLSLGSFNLLTKETAILDVNSEKSERMLKSNFRILGDENIFMHSTWYGDSNFKPKCDFVNISKKNMSVENEFSFEVLQVSMHPHFEVIHMNENYFLVQSKSGQRGDLQMEYLLYHLK